MDLDRLLTKLLAAGRLTPPNESVPYAFEKRVMARLGSVRPLDLWGFWSRGLWRAVAPCLAVMLACGLWAHFSDPPYPGDLSEDLEATLLSPLDQELEEEW